MVDNEGAGLGRSAPRSLIVVVGEGAKCWRAVEGGGLLVD